MSKDKEEKALDITTTRQILVDGKPVSAGTRFKDAPRALAKNLIGAGKAKLTAELTEEDRAGISAILDKQLAKAAAKGVKAPVPGAQTLAPAKERTVDDLTVAELKEALSANGVEFDAKATKAELVALLKEAAEGGE